jgi:hypothetical protein
MLLQVKGNGENDDHRLGFKKIVARTYTSILLGLNQKFLKQFSNGITKIPLSQISKMKSILEKFLSLHQNYIDTNSNS